MLQDVSSLVVARCIDSVGSTTESLADACNAIALLAASGALSKPKNHRDELSRAYEAVLKKHEEAISEILERDYPQNLNPFAQIAQEAALRAAALAAGTPFQPSYELRAALQGTQKEGASKPLYAVAKDRKRNRLLLADYKSALRAIGGTNVSGKLNELAAKTPLLPPPYLVGAVRHHRAKKKADALAAAERVKQQARN